jgi:lipopolysaccharide/colanic/teichoic acid biosynthesis glycosyltransferase
MKGTLIVDGGWAGRLLQLTLLHGSDADANVIGFVDAEPQERQAHPKRLAALAELFDVDRVVLTTSAESTESVRSADALRELGVTVDIVRSGPGGVETGTDAGSGDRTLTFDLPRSTISRPARIAKRTMDVTGALVGLVVASPLFAYAAWRIKRESPGPIFARRRCLGMGMNEFRALDFRTTQTSAAEATHREYLRQAMLGRNSEGPSASIDRDPDEGVTAFGRRLRGTGLAELPRLINVLRGEMSLVGPRPSDVHERDVFEPRHFERFLVPAGLTGPLQSAQEGPIAYTAGLEMEVEYARTRSLRGDAALLFRMALSRARPGAVG